MQIFNLLDVKISAINLDLASLKITEWIDQAKKVYVCVAPVATIIDCQKNEEYKTIINSAQMVTPDGMPVVWLGKLNGFKSMTRTYGPDLMLEMCRLSETKGYSHYFYGGTPKTLELLIVKLKEKFPGIKISGTMAPDYLEPNEKVPLEVIDQINQAKPDILWVGLGSPKQDYWMKNHREVLKAPVIVGVGAAFDFIAGVKPQAPKWMQKSGLEWLFRFGCEPRRLWRRYLMGNSLFIWLVFVDGCKKLINKFKKV